MHDLVRVLVTSTMSVSKHSMYGLIEIKALQTFEKFMAQPPGNICSRKANLVEIQKSSPIETKW